MDENQRALGRPTKLSPQLQTRIVRLVKAGNYIETAAAACGVAKRTLYEWLRLGNAEDLGSHRDFLHAVEQALADAEQRDLSRVDRAAAKNWKAAAWRLERRNPRRWGPRVQLAVQEELVAFLDHLQANLPAEVYERVLTAAAGWEGSQEPSRAASAEALP